MYVRWVGPIAFSICSLLSGEVLAASAAAASDASVAPSDTSSRAGSGELQEIVVTAQKRQQALSDVGITIVAATAEQLQNAGVTDVASLSKVVPGLTTTINTNGGTIYSIRGVNYNAYNLSAQPAVAVYLDEAPLPYAALTQGAMLDVQRVEVLKGPQGTLFGQNSTGGSVNIIAAKPTATFAAGTQVSVNNWDGVSASMLKNSWNLKSWPMRCGGWRSVPRSRQLRSPPSPMAQRSPVARQWSQSSSAVSSWIGGWD